MNIAEDWDSFEDRKQWVHETLHTKLSLKGFDSNIMSASNWMRPDLSMSNAERARGWCNTTPMGKVFWSPSTITANTIDLPRETPPGTPESPSNVLHYLNLVVKLLCAQQACMKALAGVADSDPITTAEARVLDEDIAGAILMFRVHNVALDAMFGLRDDLVDSQDWADQVDIDLTLEYIGEN